MYIKSVSPSLSFFLPFSKKIFSKKISLPEPECRGRDDGGYGCGRCHGCYSQHVLLPALRSAAACGRSGHRKPPTPMLCSVHKDVCRRGLGLISIDVCIKIDDEKKNIIKEVHMATATWLSTVAVVQVQEIIRNNFIQSIRCKPCTVFDLLSLFNEEKGYNSQQSGYLLCSAATLP